ncbi:MAG: Lcl domain-containing protein, partial [Mobilitalea sp.]
IDQSKVFASNKESIIKALKDNGRVIHRDAEVTTGCVLYEPTKTSPIEKKESRIIDTVKTAENQTIPMEVKSKQIPVNDQNIFFDDELDLMWKINIDLSRVNKQESKTIIDKLNLEFFNGYNNWRLPTAFEIKSFCNRKNINKILKQTNASAIYWVSTSVSDKCCDGYDCAVCYMISGGLDITFARTPHHLLLTRDNTVKNHPQDWKDILIEWADEAKLSEYDLKSDCTRDAIIKSSFYPNNGFPRHKIIFTNLKVLNLSFKKLTRLPDEIINLDNLTSLDLTDNPSLVLTNHQMKWIKHLSNKGCKIKVDITN